MKHFIVQVAIQKFYHVNVEADEADDAKFEVEEMSSSDVEKLGDCKQIIKETLDVEVNQ